MRCKDFEINHVCSTLAFILILIIYLKRLSLLIHETFKLNFYLINDVTSERKSWKVFNSANFLPLYMQKKCFCRETTIDSNDLLKS